MVAIAGQYLVRRPQHLLLDCGATGLSHPYLQLPREDPRGIYHIKEYLSVMRKKGNFELVKPIIVSIEIMNKVTC